MTEEEQFQLSDMIYKVREKFQLNIKEKTIKNEVAKIMNKYNIDYYVNKVQQPKCYIIEFSLSDVMLPSVTVRAFTQYQLIDTKFQTFHNHSFTLFWSLDDDSFEDFLLNVEEFAKHIYDRGTKITETPANCS